MTEKNSGPFFGAANKPSELNGQAELRQIL